MEKFLIFVVFASTLIGWIITMLDGDRDGKVSFLSAIGGFLCVVIPMACFISFAGSPSAMDVYKGKITLQITYKDSIPVDSIVVFKDRENYDKR